MLTSLAIFAATATLSLYSGPAPEQTATYGDWITGCDSARMLENHILHRAIGDCGRIDRFIWDGKQFRLAEQRVMPECRGSMARIRVWKVDLVER